MKTKRNCCNCRKRVIANETGSNGLPTAQTACRRPLTGVDRPSAGRQGPSAGAVGRPFGPSGAVDRPSGAVGRGQFDINSESCQDNWLLNKTIIIKIDHLQALCFDKIHSKIGKRVVGKETPCIATEHHVVLSFNLQAVYIFFPLWYAGEARIDVGRPE